MGVSRADGKGKERVLRRACDWDGMGSAWDLRRLRLKLVCCMARCMLNVACHVVCCMPMSHAQVACRAQSFMGPQDLRRLQIDVVESVDRRIRVRRRHHDVVTERLARPHVSIAACNVQQDIATSAYPGSREITMSRPNAKAVFGARARPCTASGTASASAVLCCNKPDCVASNMPSVASMVYCLATRAQSASADAALDPTRYCRAGAIGSHLQQRGDVGGRDDRSGGLVQLHVQTHPCLHRSHCCLRLNVVPATMHVPTPSPSFLSLSPLSLSSPVPSAPLLSSPLSLLSSPPRRAAPLLRQAVVWQGRYPSAARPIGAHGMSLMMPSSIVASSSCPKCAFESSGNGHGRPTTCGVHVRLGERACVRICAQACVRAHACLR